jgi:GntR family transcriptional regulator / MocR family aminotransferase
MKETWATSPGLDLHLEVSGAGVRRSLEAALREAVRSGRLAAGTALPSSRALAQDLGIARNTVVDAYGQLVAEGWLAASHGSGTWVAERTEPPGAVPPAKPAAKIPAIRYDLRPGVPDVSAFPRAAWLAAARRVLAVAPATTLSYTDPRGLQPLREALAEYLARARGVAVTPDRVVVCAGYAQALELLCQVLRAQGASRLAVEGFGLPAHWRIVTGGGLALCPLAVDAGGAVVSELAGAGGAGAAAAVALTPAHQFPLGVALEPRRRREVVDWAAGTGGLVIEDDYDGEFRYDRQAVGALQSLAPEHVAYAGTASKSLAPGLRLGWLVLPGHLVADVVEAKRAAGRLSSSLDQLTLAEFIGSGGYDRQVRRARVGYRRRRDRLVAELARRAPQVRVTGIAAGLHALVVLPAGTDERAVVAEGARRGLALQGLAEFSAGAQPHDPAVIVGYATPPGHQFTTAVARLCAVLREVT